MEMLDDGVVNRLAKSFANCADALRISRRPNSRTRSLKIAHMDRVLTGIADPEGKKRVVVASRRTAPEVSWIVTCIMTLKGSAKQRD